MKASNSEWRGSVVGLGTAADVSRDGKARGGSSEWKQRLMERQM